MQKKATRQDQRIQNRRLVLQSVLAHAPISRADIVRSTGLTAASVSAIVAELENQGLVLELGTGPSAGGKPPTLFGINAGAYSIISVDLSDGERAGSVLDLLGTSAYRTERSRDALQGQEGIDQLIEMINELLAETPAPPLGIGIGSPGVIDDKGTVVEASFFDWHGIPLGALLAERYALPVHVINNSRAAALAEYSFGRHEAENLLVVKIGNGVGAGVVLDGRIHGGEDSAAGEIGHVVVDPNGAPCFCGMESAGASANQGDPGVLKTIDEAARNLGKVLSTTVAILDIHKVVITGVVSRLGSHFLSRLRDEIDHAVLPTLASKLEFCYGRTGAISTHETVVFGSGNDTANNQHVERLVKFLLWQRGASTVLISGPAAIAAHLQQVYSATGARAFDVDFMTRVYETPFTIEHVESVPDTNEPTVSLGRHLEGNRIGLDLGASDYKISAVVDGEAVYADEISWMPRNATELSYHYERITEGLRKAASHLSKVDAIGGSSAGVWIDDRVRVASLFRGLSREEFDAAATNLFVRIRNEWGVPLNVVNDGEVTALAGSMSLEANGVLGVAMGSSEAVGYVTQEGTITRWLNELAFAPFDYQEDAPPDEWSGDIGCGVQYFCQTGVIRLATRAGIELDAELTPAEKLVVVQQLMADGDERVPAIYETIGIWFGYALAHYAAFYEIDHVLVLGRVTSGKGGEIIVDRARQVLSSQFPELRMELHVPDERMKRVGQSVAAASLPELAKEPV